MIKKMNESTDNPIGLIAKNNKGVETSPPNITPKAGTSKPSRVENGNSSGGEHELPKNILETENIHASAIKNNNDEIGVKKTLKKVATKNPVLAMVKLREEKEKANKDGKLPTKITRAKYKELMKASPKSAAWNLELTPIKHIPVKTRPEVTALIAQDLPEDEDDDEYEPTHDDVVSDDDQTLESCSDADSQPRTPATPIDPATSSPQVVKDGPFKVPQNITSAKRKLDLEEEDATIARRTRSKLSLSSTSIEHIESTFIPPDDIRRPVVDDLWNQFLNECLNPASTSRNEDDDEADPEYNVAADTDAVEEDEDNLSKSIIKISKKELNDLMTELFAVMPEDLGDNLVNSVLSDTSHSEIPRWEGKQETLSDEEATDNISNRLQLEKNNTFNKFSVGKTEPEDCDERNDDVVEKNEKKLSKKDENLHNNNDNLHKNDANLCKNDVNLHKNDANLHKNDKKLHNKDENLHSNDKNVHKNDEHCMTTDANMKNGFNSHEEVVIIEIKEEDIEIEPDTSGPTCVTVTTTEQATEAPSTESAPPLLQQLLRNGKQQEPETQVVLVQVDSGFTVLPQQILIFQQQLRQHIQLATFNFLQLFVHPIHWSFAPNYKEYVQSLVKICESNPKSVANVCNLKPALELMTSWEKTVAEKTPANAAMVKFIQDESDKCRHRTMNNASVMGEFPEQLRRVVANSGVFLYPHLLQNVPYRPDHVKRFSYIAPEDELLAIGLEQFWEYIDNNPKLFKKRMFASNSKHRAGLTITIEQITKYMLPWMSARHILCHVQHIRKHGHSENPIIKYFKKNKVDPVKHVLLPFDPKKTLYEHPSSEIPRSWLKYLGKTSNRFKKHLARKDNLIQPTTGVPVEMGKAVEVPQKNPLPIHFNQEVTGTALPNTNLVDNSDANKPKTDVLVATNIFSVVQTSNGMVLVPLLVQNTNVVNSVTGPIPTPTEVQTNVNENKAPENTQESDKIAVTVLEKPIEKSKTVSENNLNESHCECCILLRKICKEMKLITDYFKPTRALKKQCQCRDRTFPKVSNRLKSFLPIFKCQSQVMLKELEEKMNSNSKDVRTDCNADDFEYAVSYLMRLLTRLNLKTRKHMFQRRLNMLFSEFDVGTDDPIQLAQKLYDIVNRDLVATYNEFLGFLTAEQAENAGVFKHYLVSHIKSLMQRIEEDIPDIERRRAVLTQIKQFFKNQKELTSCQMCNSLLLELKDYPRLAKYVFSLFPHKTCPQRDVTIQLIRTDVETELPTDEAAPVVQKANEISSDTVKDTNSGPVIVDSYSVHERETPIENNASEKELNIAPTVTSNVDADDDSLDRPETPNNSILIMPNEIKTEREEWTREEDKILLEIIQQYLASDESKNKSIYKVLQDNKVYQLIAEHMTEKSMDDIVQRVLYLLEVLIVNNS